MGLFFSVYFLLDINLRNEGITTGLSIFNSETKPEKSVDSQLMLERPDRAFFSCLRQIIFCKFTVTSVLFSVYYIDSKPTLKCNGRVPDHRIFTVCVYVCVSNAGMIVCMCKMMVTWMRQESERDNADQIHICILNMSFLQMLPQYFSC